MPIIFGSFGDDYRFKQEGSHVNEFGRSVEAVLPAMSLGSVGHEKEGRGIESKVPVSTRKRRM
jgi:hypothetical protein